MQFQIVIFVSDYKLLVHTRIFRMQLHLKLDMKWEGIPSRDAILFVPS